MDNFCILVCSTETETQFQEFSLPLDEAQIEQWSQMTYIQLYKINSDFSELFSEKTFQVGELVQMNQVEPLKCYFVTGIPSNIQGLKNVELLKNLLQISTEEAERYLEVFQTLEGAYIGVLQNNRPQLSTEALKLIDLLESGKDGKLEKLKTLLSTNFIDPYATDMDGKTFLHLACSSNKINIVDYILKSKFTKLLNFKTKLNQETPIFFATFYGNYEIVQMIINSLPLLIDLNELNKYGQNLVHVAAKSSENSFNNPTGILKLLHQKGLNINLKDKFFEQTPLHYAVQNGDLKNVKTLIELGADPNIQDFIGRTPCHLAKYLSLTVIYEYLCSKTNLFLLDQLGMTAHKKSTIIYPISFIPFNQFESDDRIDLASYIKAKCKFQDKTITLLKLSVPSLESAKQTFKEIIEMIEQSYYLLPSDHHHVIQQVTHISIYNQYIILLYPKSYSIENVHASSAIHKMELCLNIIKLVEFLHNQKIILKNLNLSNIRVTPFKEDYFYNFTDVGLSYGLSSYPEELQKYFAPEVKQGQFTTKSDIYSLGICLFEIVFGISFELYLQIKIPDMFDSFMRLILDMKSNNPDDRPTIRDVYDRMVSARKDLLLDGIKTGKFQFKCKCPKVHTFEEISLNYNLSSKRLIDENNRYQKKYFIDDRKLNILAEGKSQSYMYQNWTVFLEHIKSGYKDGTKDDLSNAEIILLENIKKFIFDEPNNSSLFTKQSVTLLEKLILKITNKWHTCLDLLRYLVLNPHSLHLILYTDNKIFLKIFSTKWLDQSTPSKVLLLRLFTNLLASKDPEAISFIKEPERLDKIIIFACCGLQESESEKETKTKTKTISFLPVSISLAQNLSILHMYLSNSVKKWENLLSTTTKILKSEQDLGLLLVLYRLIKDNQEFVTKTIGMRDSLQNWTTSSSIYNTILEIYDYYLKENDSEETEETEE